MAEGAYLKVECFDHEMIGKERERGGSFVESIFEEGEKRVCRSKS